MKTALLIFVLAGAVASGAKQTNAPVAATVPVQPVPALETPKASGAEASSPNPIGLAAAPVARNAASMPLTPENLPKIEPKIPVEGIEGRRVNYTGVVPLAVKAGGFKGVLNLFNPFAPLSSAEKRRAVAVRDRPAPRGFVDDTKLEPVGIMLISVETK
jgi:hypothetical protein